MKLYGNFMAVHFPKQYCQDNPYLFELYCEEVQFSWAESFQLFINSVK